MGAGEPNAKMMFFTTIRYNTLNEITVEDTYATL